MYLLRLLGFAILEPFRIQAPEGRIFNLKYSDKAFVQTLRHLIRVHLYSRASQTRPHLRTTQSIQWEATRRLFLRRDYAKLPDIVAILTDGIWTAPRLIHTGHVTTRDCWWCGPEQSPGHLFWECPHFASSRPRLMMHYRPLVETHPPAYHCGICLQNFPEPLQRQWEAVQRFMCEVSHACGEYFAEDKKQRKDVPSCSRPGRSGDDVGSGLPPLPALGVYARSRPLDFTTNIGRYAQGHYWCFPQTQLHQLQWFLTQIRVATEADAGSFAGGSVLELYISYLVANGWARFLSGAPEQPHGSRLTSHLEAFREGFAVSSGYFID